MENVVIVASVRTPVGSFQGALSSLPSPKLGAIAIKAALEKSGAKPEHIKDVIMGQVLTAGSGQAPARQAAIFAGLQDSTTCYTINKVCGSGLKAVMLATDAIRLGHTDAVIAGGQENMSLAPHLLENSRTGYRMGNVQMSDSMLKDGLWDPYNNWHMGNAAELCASEFKFSREAQDAFAVDSYKKAHKFLEMSSYANEIANVTIEGKEKIVVSRDEEPGKAKFDKMPALKPAFDKAGTITAANASKINDGASAHVLMSESRAKALGLKPLARIVSQGHFAQDPKWFTTAPVGAIKNALSAASLKSSDIGLWEINEAFANVTMAAQKSLDLDMSKINVHGGAIAIGHPIGASGARILTTLVHAMQTHNQKYGCASLCIGGGEGVALIIEKI